MEAIACDPPDLRCLRLAGNVEVVIEMIVITTPVVPTRHIKAILIELDTIYMCVLCVVHVVFPLFGVVACGLDLLPKYQVLWYIAAQRNCVRVRVRVCMYVCLRFFFQQPRHGERLIFRANPLDYVGDYAGAVAWRFFGCRDLEPCGVSKWIEPPSESTFFFCVEGCVLRCAHNKNVS